MQRKKSKGISAPQHRALQIEELEERIAPVVVTSSTGWIQGTASNSWPDTPDAYWIFYVGPGSADIRNDAGGTDIDGHHIGNITITGSDSTSALFILDYPGDDTPNADDTGFATDAGTIWVQGDITVNGDIGLIEIDGLYGSTGGQPTLTVNGNLGKLDVGILTGNVLATGDIYEVDVDMTIGGFINGEGDYVANTDTTIAAYGNIGAVRAGVGLTDSGEAIDTYDVLGGSISGNTTIRANADSSGAPGIIDLIEARGGSLLPGNLGQEEGDVIPTISAGPGGNVRFIHLDGNAYWTGAGNYAPIEEITVTTESALVERTIVDDSGGIMVINPQETVFTAADGTVTTYDGSVTYLAIPVGPPSQEPGVVVARMTVDNSNSFNISGNVEIGDLRMGTNFAYPQGQTESLDDLDIEGPGDLTGLEGYAHDIFAGTGEADIYFVNAMSEFGAPGSTVPIVINNTTDGDIVLVGADTDVIYVGASTNGGDVGATESISPYLIKGPIVAQDADVLWVDTNDDPDIVDPFGVEGSLTRYSTIQGVFATGNIYGVNAGGAIGDVRSIGGDIHYVRADANHMHDAGSPLVMTNLIAIPVANGTGGAGLSAVATGGYGYTGTVSISGKVDNIVGDGIFGLVMSGTGSDYRDSLAADGLSGDGSIGLVRVGEGSEPTWVYGANAYPEEAGLGQGDGTRVSAGIYTSGSIDRVIASGSGTGIYGDVIGSTNNPDTDFAVNQVAAVNGAVIDGSWASSGFIRISTINTHARILYQIEPTGDLGTITASGAGSYISDLNIDARSIDRIVTSGGSGGISNSTIGANEGDLMLISSDADINNCQIFVNGIGGTIQTTGRTSDIVNSDIRVLAGLKNLRTNSLQNDSIYLATLGHLSTLDTIDNTTFVAAGLRHINVKNDIINGSDIHVTGPLDRLTVGGTIDNSIIQSTGIWANMGRVIVKGDITNSEIYSEHNITLVQSRTGSIVNTDITALGSSDLDADLTLTKFARIGRVQAAGDISGTIYSGYLNEFTANPDNDSLINARLDSVKAGGNISADVYVGTVRVNGDIGGDMSVTARIGRIVAGGSVSGDVVVGNVASMAAAPDLGDVNGVVNITAKVGPVKSGGTISGDILVGGVYADNDVNGAVNIDARLSSIKADGGLTGDVEVGRVVAVNDVNGNVSVPEVLGAVKIGGDITGDIHVGAVDAGNDINGDVTFNGRVSSIKADGAVTGSVYVGSEAAGNAVIGAVTGTGKVGSITASGGGVTGDVDILGNLGALKAAGDVGYDGGLLEVGGNLGRLSAGDRTSTGNLLSDVTVGGNLGGASVTGAFPGSLDVGGNAGRIQVTGDIGEIGDTFTVGGRVSNVTVGDSSTLSDFLSDVSITGNLGLFKVSGDVGDENAANPLVPFDIGGNVGRIMTGRIFSDIHVIGNLSLLRTGSGVVPGADPPDYDFINPGFQTGHLTVDGRIGHIV